MSTLTDSEIEELRIAIAEEMGLVVAIDRNFNGLKLAVKHCDTSSGALWKECPLYTTSLGAIQQAAMERFKKSNDMRLFACEVEKQSSRNKCYVWQLTPLDWCIAFARTAKIWRYKP